MIKYVIFDLDGTLLNRRKEVGKLSYKEISRLRKEGIHFIAASGRRIPDITKYTKQLEFDKNDFIISCDGLYIHDHIGCRLWNNIYINSNQLQFLVNIYRHSKIIIFTENNDFIFRASLIEKILRTLWYRYKKVDRTIFIQDYKNITGNIEKIRIELERKSKPFDDKNISKLTIHKVFDKYIDITAENVNKMTALNCLLNYLGVSLSEVIYFGDDFNDIECFDTIKYSVALKNGQKEILDNAYFITESNDDDGVGLFLKNVKNGIICNEKNKNKIN